MKKQNKLKKNHHKPIAGYITFGLIYVLAVFIFSLINWSTATYGANINEILYTLATPLKGTDAGVISSAIKNILPPVLMASLPLAAFIFADCKNKLPLVLKGKFFKCEFTLNLVKLMRKTAACLCVGLLVLSVIFADSQYKIIDYVFNRYLAETKIYDNYYIDPLDVKIEASGEKTKNLVFIYVESLETNYASKELGGNQSTNLIPNLTSLADPLNGNVSFSHTDGFGGLRAIYGSTWTMGALFAASSGIPFAFPVSGNDMGRFASFAKGTVTLGDVLYQKGYRQEFLCGSDASYASRDAFFRQHGNHEIFDLFTAREKGYIPKNYHNNTWGFEDKYLYEIAKDELLRLSSGDEPFNLTMLTVDTHFPGGYICELCDESVSNSSNDVLKAETSIRCADRQLTDFLNWCKQQPFYEDTVFVIIGDHPRMDRVLIDDISYYERTIYNCFINASFDKELLSNKNRECSLLDILPTTLSALGFSIEGDRLGLGTNLFSDSPTLCESLGFGYLCDEFKKNSPYYIKNFR